MTLSTTTIHEPLAPDAIGVPYHRAVYMGPNQPAGAECPRCGEIVPNPDNYGPARHWAIAVAVERSKAEILEDIRTGRVPADVPDFSALHDYVDANEYGGLCSDSPWIDQTDPDGGLDMAWSDASNEVQNRVNEWLKGARQ